MACTVLSISGERFLINGRLTYSDLPTARPEALGLLMNARFIQGVFDDRSGRGRYARWGRSGFDPEQNTDDLIAALPAWRESGLRAFTVGFQGGGPCFTIDRESIDNNPFGEGGERIDGACAARMDRLIRASDALGIVVIVSYFYGSQALRLRDERAVRNAVVRASRFLRDGAYGNVIVEVANEQNVEPFRRHPVIHEPDGMVELIELARAESGGLPVGCSSWGNHVERSIASAGDVVLIHGNGCSRQQFANLAARAREFAPGRPVLCNEDSQAIGQLAVAYATRTSWGYYNNLTKQEPPTDWRILPGEDTYFALRMAEGIGIPTTEPEGEEQYFLHGFEPALSWNGMRWIRLACLYPERVDRVEFHRGGALYQTVWDEPFSVNFRSNWYQEAVRGIDDDEEWRAVVHLCDGQVVEKVASVASMTTAH